MHPIIVFAVVITLIARGVGQELLSMNQQAEQELISKTVWIILNTVLLRRFFGF